MDAAKILRTGRKRASLAVEKLNVIKIVVIIDIAGVNIRLQRKT